MASSVNFRTPTFSNTVDPDCDHHHKKAKLNDHFERSSIEHATAEEAPISITTIYENMYSQSAVRGKDSWYV